MVCGAGSQGAAFLPRLPSAGLASASLSICAALAAEISSDDSLSCDKRAHAALWWYETVCV